MSHYDVKFVPGTKNHCWNKAFDMVQPGSTILDVGCSTGDFGRALKDLNNCKVDGIEPDAGDAKKASAVLDNVYVGFVEEALKLTKGKKYDHIIFMDVIEHLYDPVATIQAVKKHLKSEGTIIFSIPNMAHVSVRLMLLKGDFEYGNTGLLDKTHLHFYTRREIDRVFNEAGMAVGAWDATEATYPEALIKKELQALGLKPDKSAIKTLSSDEAQIFQYVGSASTATSKQKSSVRRIEYSPDPQGQITEYYESKLKSLQDEYDYIHNDLKDLQKKMSDEAYLIKRLRLATYAKGYVKNKMKRS